MATGVDPKPKLISLSELDAVLEQARVEGWRELAIFGPGEPGCGPTECPKHIRSICVSRLVRESPS